MASSATCMSRGTRGAVLTATDICMEGYMAWERRKNGD